MPIEIKEIFNIKQFSVIHIRSNPESLSGVNVKLVDNKYLIESIS
jgi:hypothetical protein